MTKPLIGVCATLLIILAVLGFLLDSKLKTIAELEAKLQIESQNTQILSESLEKQNALIREMQVVQNVVDTSKILEIEVRDATCEAELKAYKHLFKELGR